MLLSFDGARNANIYGRSIRRASFLTFAEPSRAPSILPMLTFVFVKVGLRPEVAVDSCQSRRSMRDCPDNWNLCLLRLFLGNPQRSLFLAHCLALCLYPFMTVALLLSWLVCRGGHLCCWMPRSSQPEGAVPMLSIDFLKVKFPLRTSRPLPQPQCSLNLDHLAAIQDNSHIAPRHIRGDDNS